MIVCDDQPDPEVISRLMDGEKAACGFADPPYNVPISGHVSGLAKSNIVNLRWRSGK